MSVEIESVGYPNAEEVKHIADSERPFAAIMSAISGFTVEAVQRTLDDAGLSQPDETLGKIRLEGKKKAITVAPIRLSDAIGPKGIAGRIKNQLAEGDAVALYHKADHHSKSTHSWTLLTAYRVDESGTESAVKAINPRRGHANSWGPHKILEIIKGSTLPEESPGGIYAYAVNTEYIHRPLTVIYESDEETAAIKDTYGATGQDKTKPPNPAA